MGVFSTYDNVRGGNQKISERFLKQMGFEKSNQWGAPSKWGKDSEFWEKIITVKEGYTDASLIYFPPTFRAWVTPFDMNGQTPANKMIGEINSTSTEIYDFTGDALCKMDIYYGIDKITENLKTYLKIN
jgi:hypothetical protein